MKVAAVLDSNQFSIIFIGYVWPEPVSSAAGIRTLSLLQAIQKFKPHWKIHFLSPAKDNSFAAALRALNVSTHTIAANDPIFDSLIKTLKPTHVLFDRFVLEEQFGWRVKENSPEALRIIDTQDLHFLRRAREAAFQSKSPLELKTEDSYREIAAIYRSDSSLIISDYEMRLLMENLHIPSNLLELTRFFYPATNAFLTQEKKHFVFIGNYRHPPNYDAVFWLCKEIWPKIYQKLPHAELHLYGSYPPKEVSMLHDPNHGIHFFGPAKDQYKCLAQYRINLAPLRFGAGIKGKISDGWHVGTPCVSTNIGAEGMGYADNEAWAGLVANTTDEFATASISLYEDQFLWQNCAKECPPIMEKLFSFPTNASQFIHHLEKLWEEKNERRQKNFIGQMLWHHTLQSTKYLSRWIEEKNNHINTKKEGKHG